MQAYLDHNASAPLRDEAKSAMIDALELVGNPSSIHRQGRIARKMIEDVRQSLADYAQILPKQVVFTSGASEAAHLALGDKIRIGSTRKNLSHLYISAIEHPCILAGGRFGPDNITKFGVTREGMVDLAELEAVLSSHDHELGAPLVAAMAVNNETGIVQPLAEISHIVKAHHGYLCVDAVQAFGKLDINLSALGAHFLLLSAHKIGGPKGVGALLIMDGNIAPEPLMKGGGQENQLRAGTENVAAIAGFGAAINTVRAKVNDRQKIRQLRDDIETQLEEISRQSSNNTPLPIIFGANNTRLDNTCCFAVEGVKAEQSLIALDLAGIAVSSGSACSSGRVNQSHVLSAMGVSPQLAECTLRLSLGAETTSEQTGHFLNAWKNIVEHRA